MNPELKERLSSDLVTHVTAMCGQRGEAWFDELPALVSTLEVGFVRTVIGAWWNFEDMPDLYDAYDAELAIPDIWDV